MCEHDLEAGVAIVDIGGGTTDLAVFYEGILKATAVIPFGGENITNDIKMGLIIISITQVLYSFYLYRWLQKIAQEHDDKNVKVE
jgi:ethanolamine utilization protein EutA (predicted chaperonin)